MNLNAILGALKSPKTPAHLKKGLMKKYGHLLGNEKIPASALATTVHANPGYKKTSWTSKGTPIVKKVTRCGSNPPYGYGKEWGNPKRISALVPADVYVTKMPEGYYVDYPAKRYTGLIKTKAKLEAFLRPAKAMGLRISRGL
jgi:hypothetical protein